MTDAYRTVADRGQARFEVQGSEFIGYAIPVASVAEAESAITSIREQHSDATHNVPGYRVRDGEFLRAYESDDGEPSGSAGEPIMNVLTGQDLENVAVVVTRYFGGTELGIGGLVSAYSRATTAAIDDAGIVTRQPHERLQVTVPYDDSGTVRSILESEALDFEAAYDATVTFTITVPEPAVDALIERLQSATSGRIELE